MDIHKFYKKYGGNFRKKRMALFQELFRPSTNIEILDVGGSENNWLLLDAEPKVVLFNITHEKNETKGRFSYVKGDGRKLPYPDKCFDIVYSNSVIEHVGTFEDQKAFAKEIARVGKSYFVQTPNKSFFIEPHFIAPFIHFFPRTVQIKFVRWFTLWGLMTKPSRKTIHEMVNSINLLGPQEFQALFPDAKIKVERFFGFSKSLIAYETKAQTP